MHEMPVTALQSKAEWQPVERIDQADQRRVDFRLAKAGQGFALVAGEVWIIDQRPWFRERFQDSVLLPDDTPSQKRATPAQSELIRINALHDGMGKRNANG